MRERGRRRRRHGGLQPRPGAGPGRRRRLRRRRLHQPRPRTTWTSTATWRTTSRPRPSCSPRSCAAVGVVNIDDDYGRELAARGQGPGDHLLRRGPPGRRLARRGRRARRRRQHASACVGPGGVEADGRRSPLPGPVQRRQRPRRDRRAGRGRGRPADRRRTASPPLPGVPGRLERVDAGQPDFRPSSTTRTRPTPSSRCCARCARSPRAGCTSCSAAAATATGASAARWARPRRGWPTRRAHLRQPALRGPPRDPRRDAARARRGARARARRMCSSSPTGRAAIDLRSPGPRRGDVPCWSRARATSRARTSPEWCIPFDDRQVVAMSAADGTQAQAGEHAA